MQRCSPEGEPLLSPVCRKPGKEEGCRNLSQLVADDEEKILEGAVRRRRRWPPEVRLERVKRSNGARVRVFSCREKDDGMEDFKSRFLATNFKICPSPPQVPNIWQKTPFAPKTNTTLK